MDLIFFFFWEEAPKGVVMSVVTSHVSRQIVPHGDAAPKGMAPLSISRRRRGVRGVGRGFTLMVMPEKQLLRTNLTVY